VKKVYIDTSAFFKTFEEEPSDVVEPLILLAREKKIEIIISDWLINETIALVDENKRKGNISEAQVQGILSEIVSMMGNEIQYENFILYPITNKIIIASRLAIQEYRINAADALHVFISAAVGCDCFVSADEKLINQLTTGSSKLIAFNIRTKEDVKNLFKLLNQSN
jgi:predicted nucleic acid-binding protein